MFVLKLSGIQISLLLLFFRRLLHTRELHALVKSYDAILLTNAEIGNIKQGSSISRQKLNVNLEPVHLAPKLFYHLFVFY